MPNQILFQIQNRCLCNDCSYSTYFLISAFPPCLSFLFSRKEAQLDEEGQFLVRIIYDDSKTYDLVAAASKVLSKLNVTFLLWLSYTQKPKECVVQDHIGQLRRLCTAQPWWWEYLHIMWGSGYAESNFSFYKLFREQRSSLPLPTGSHVLGKEKIVLILNVIN